MKSKKIRTTILTVIIVLIVTYTVSWTYASGAKIYFSPSTLETKSQKEILLLFTKVPLYKSAPEIYKTKLVQYLISQGYWKESKETEPQWILTNHWNDQWKDGHSYLQKKLHWEQKTWMAWTIKNPNLAKEFWPQVLEKIRKSENIYSYFEAAEHSSSVEEYEETLKLLRE